MRCPVPSPWKSHIRLLTQPRVLRLFARLAREQQRVAFRDVARELGISEQAAVSTLERLWHLQLIIPPGARPAGFKWRPAPGELVGTLSFCLTHRGEKKLRWWDKKRGRESAPWSFLPGSDR